MRILVTDGMDKTAMAELREKAKLTLVSATSIVEGGAHDVLLKDTTNGNQRS